MGIDLMKFCSKDRPRLSEPFSRGEWTYATNGHIAIRVPRLPEIPEKKDAPDAERVFVQADKDGPCKWVSVPKVEAPVREECDTCDGTGKMEVSKEKLLECDKCDGEGYYVKPEPVKFPFDDAVIGLSNIYLDLIRKELPNSRIGLTARAVNTPAGAIGPVKIKFDGGSGLLMAMRLP